MFNGAVAREAKPKQREGEASWVMVDWVALWQAAKKGLSHSPYVTCFPSASAVRICYQSAPAEGLGVLNRSYLTTPPFLSFLPVSLFSFYPPPSVLLVSHVTWMWSLTRECWCMLKAWPPQHTHTRTHTCARQRAHINRTPTYSYVSSAVTLSHSHVPVCLLFSEGRGLEEYCFPAWDRPLVVMCRTAHFSPSLS